MRAVPPALSIARARLGWGNLAHRTAARAQRHGRPTEMQTYNRTLIGLGMELEFINLGNGETLRRVEGRLTKRAD